MFYSSQVTFLPFSMQFTDYQCLIYLRDCSGLISVTIPSYVTSIGDGAFRGCSGLTSINVDSHNTKYDSRSNCNAIIETATNTLITGCNNTIILNSVTSIGDYAFEGCSGLTNIIIPNYLTSIGNYAFYGCSGLTSITIPNSLTSIGGNAFYGCSGLTSINIPNYVTSIGDGAFYNCSGLTSITIPNSVTSIGDYTFEGCSGLTNIIIPNYVTSIGDGAFYDCSGLTSITIPNSLTSIGAQAFYNTGIYTNSPDGVFYVDKWVCGYKGTMPSNTSISLQDGTLGIADQAFITCFGLTSINIPNSVKSIGDHAFWYCSGLTSITIPNSVTSIGDYAFIDCSGLTSATIGNSVTSIGEYAFWRCSSLTSVNIPNSVTSIGESAFRDCSSLTSVTIGNSVTSIGESAFRDCSSLTSVTIGNSVTSIRESAFSGCSGLTSINIPNSVTSIGDWTFYNCSGLTSVTIGNSVTSIGGSAFSGCSKMELINSLSPQPPVCDYGALEDVNKWNCVLTVPLGSKTAYQAADQWKDFALIVEIAGTKEHTINTSATGYATFYSSESAYTLPKGLSAQVVTNASNDKLTYRTIADGSVSGVVPKGVAVMLVSDEKQTGAFTLTSSESAATYNGNNLLHGSDEATTTTGNGLHYKLSYGHSSTLWSDVFGWFWGAQDGAPFLIEANKAWLVVPQTNNSRTRGYEVGGDALYIEDIENNNSELMNNDLYYDLQGRRIGQPTKKGIYIKKGKVVVNK